MPADLIGDWQTRERRRHLNSRQTRRLRAEGRVGGEVPVSCRMVTDEVPEAKAFDNWFGDNWGTSPLTYSAETQTSVEVSEVTSKARPEHRNVSAQV